MDPNSSPAEPDTEAVMAAELAKDGEPIPTKDAPLEGEITQPQAAQSPAEPPKSMTIRDTKTTSFMGRIYTSR